MAIFGKREGDYEEEAKDIDFEVFSKAFKDLKTKNRGRRKEPPRPWGRFERLLVGGVLAATILTSVTLAVSARSWKLPGLPRFKLPSFGFLKEDTIIIEKVSRESEVPRVGAKEEKEIVRQFKEISKDLSGVYGLYVIDLKRGFSFGVNEKDTFQAASLIKLPVLLALYKEVEEGRLSLDSKYTLKESDKVGGAGSLGGKPAGSVVAYRELARLMGRESDNTAFNIVRRIVGDKKISETISDLAMTKSDLVKNETSPKDIGRLFEKLWSVEVVGEDLTKEILETLTDTIYEEWIKRGVPKEIRVAHKYGRELHVVNDAGIVFSDKPYVVVIMSQGIIEKEADKVISQISKTVYELETGMP